MPKRKNKNYIVTSEGKKNLRGFNIQVGKRRTSVRLAPGTLLAIKTIAELEHCNISEVFSYIYQAKEEGVSNATAIRDFAVRYFMDATTQEGHRNAGHGQLIRDKEQRKNT